MIAVGENVWVAPTAIFNIITEYIVAGAADCLDLIGNRVIFIDGAASTIFEGITTVWIEGPLTEGRYHQHG